MKTKTTIKAGQTGMNGIAYAKGAPRPVCIDKPMDENKANKSRASACSDKSKPSVSKTMKDAQQRLVDDQALAYLFDNSISYFRRAENLKVFYSPFFVDITTDALKQRIKRAADARRHDPNITRLNNAMNDNL